MTDQPKRHHYLPQFYLARFASEGKIWVYDEAADAFWPSSPRKTAVRSHYYTLVDEAGEKDTDVEVLLGRIEGRAKPGLEALDAGELLSHEDRYLISLFLGFLACRTPSFERATNEILTSFMEMIVRRNLAEPNAAEIFEHPPSELEKLLDAGEFKLEAHGNKRIAYMLDFGPRIGKSFFTANWQVLHSQPELCFVTSDNPFAIIAPYPPPENGGFMLYGIASPEVVTSFPVSSSTCLLIAGEGGEVTHAPATKGQVRHVNALTVRQAERFAISRDERHLRSLVKKNGLGPTRGKTRMQVENFDHPSGDPMKSVIVTGRKGPNEDG